MYCTICERTTDHVAASCPRRSGQEPRWYDRAACVVFAMAVVASIRFGWIRNLVT